MQNTLRLKIKGKADLLAQSQAAQYDLIALTISMEKRKRKLYIKLS